MTKPSILLPGTGAGSKHPYRLHTPVASNVPSLQAQIGNSGVLSNGVYPGYPSAIILDYVYGIAAYSYWRNRQGDNAVHPRIENYFTQRYSCPQSHQFPVAGALPETHTPVSLFGYTKPSTTSQSLLSNAAIGRFDLLSTSITCGLVINGAF